MAQSNARRSLLRAGPQADAKTVWHEPIEPTLSPEEASEQRGPAWLDERYEDQGLIGLGGMGEVRRVRDRRLNRTVAMKILRPEFQNRPTAAARFLEEAQVAAQLTHPNIVPVHDLGRLDDGRAFFTMDEVVGRTLGQVLRDLHRVSTLRWMPTDDGWTLRRLVDAFRRVCDGVSYAHARGVLHRDIKPDNVMLGTFGEVQVMDWGLAKVRGHATVLEPVAVDSGRLNVTRVGAVAGTPSYMAPEQARGEHDKLDARTDVYALGSILYEILNGSSPYGGRDALAKVLAGPPPPLTGRALGRRKAEGPEQPIALRRVVARAMARDPDERFADAKAVASALADWLDGAKKRELALTLVSQSSDLAPEVRRLRQQASSLRRQAEADLAELPPGSTVDDKRASWDLQERAKSLDLEAELKNVQVLELLRSALNEAPSTQEAHELLAAHYQDRHSRASERRDPQAIAALEALLRSHDTGRWTDYLEGRGTLTLLTDRPATARIQPLHEVARQLVPGLSVDLGSTPLCDVSLDHGSYLVELSSDGQAYTLPVQIERLRQSGNIEPGTDRSGLTHLPRALAAEEAWIAEGWAWIGGDSKALGAGARQRVWVPGFIAQIHPVTHAQFLAFLNARIDSHGLEFALEHAPRLGGLPAHGLDGLRYHVEHGRLTIAPDLDEEGPVTWVSWTSARAFCEWSAERTGQPWRLPRELEWEKAARGVDGRFFPWGDRFDPSFARIRAIHRTARSPDPIHAWSTDRSIYGVYGMAGNAREWCLDAYRAEGAPVKDGRLIEDFDEWANARSVRGGSWERDERSARAAGRDWEVPEHRAGDLGFRLVRTQEEATE
ncbi:MAG: SUMF1/EgtB/PvdO family nonheme iron enzyme [Myxococcota bacterium]